MFIQLDDHSRLRAEEIAQALKQDLSLHIFGRETAVFGCACGGTHNGRAEVIDIEFPSLLGEAAHNIAMWSRWAVRVKEKCSAVSPYTLSLSDFIEKSRLYAIFRKAFQGIDVTVEMPTILFRSGQRELTGESSHRHGFTAGDEVLVIHPGESKYVQPFSAVSESCWESAKLSIIVSEPESLPQITFDIDPSRRHKPVVSDNREYFGGDIGVSNLLTVFVAEGTTRRDRLFPVARLIAYDASTHAHTFELARDVEELH